MGFGVFKRAGSARVATVKSAPDEYWWECILVGVGCMVWH